jgi:hypothetical protein
MCLDDLLAKRSCHRLPGGGWIGAVWGTPAVDSLTISSGSNQDVLWNGFVGTWGCPTYSDSCTLPHGEEVSPGTGRVEFTKWRQIDRLLRPSSWLFLVIYFHYIFE